MTAFISVGAVTFAQLSRPQVNLGTFNADLLLLNWTMVDVSEGTESRGAKLPEAKDESMAHPEDFQEKN